MRGKWVGLHVLETRCGLGVLSCIVNEVVEAIRQEWCRYFHSMVNALLITDIKLDDFQAA